jgi:AcrR family transcriptional regulator
MARESGAEAQLSQRERGKSERRTRIVQATRDLLCEAGRDRLSVRDVASRAGVSTATIYNLFGSKLALYRSIYTENIADIHIVVQGYQTKSAVEQILIAVDHSVDLYRQDKDFYRSVMWGGASGFALDPTWDSGGETHYAFWPEMLALAIDEGHLIRDANTAALGTLMYQIAQGAIFDWAFHHDDAELLKLEIKFGFMSLIKANASEARRAEIDSMLSATTEDLMSLRRKIRDGAGS